MSQAYPGTRVNLETDMIGKYVRRAMATGSLGNDINIEQEREYAPTGISLDLLARNGFL